MLSFRIEERVTDKNCSVTDLIKRGVDFSYGAPVLVVLKYPRIELITLVVKLCLISLLY